VLTDNAPRELRGYQQEASDAVINTWAAGINRTAVVAPTGSGKSSIAASIAVRAHRDYGLDVALIAHRDLLLGQLADAVAAVDPTLPPVGIVQGSRDEFDAPIIAASIQTLMNRDRLARIGKRRVIIWDEVHHAGAISWTQVLRDMGGFEPDHFFCGLTATLRREDGKALREVIQTVAYEKSLRWAIDQGYLVKPHGLTVRIPTLDLNAVKVTAGDFQNNQLAEVMEAASPYVVQAILKHASERRPFIFAASVDAAHGIAHSLRSEGMACSAVTGDMSATARNEIYEDFRDGRTQALATVQVLTEGADFPMCDTSVIGRPTRSQNLYSQMAGRSFRLWPGKTDALVLDLVGASRVLNLVTLSDLDAGTESRKIELDGTEIPPDDDEELPPSGREPRQRRNGPVDLVTVDLLAEGNTSVLWLQTRAGYPFIQPTGGGYFVFLWPDGNRRWRVGLMVTEPSKLIYAAENGWLDEGRAWPIEIAVAIAEDAVEHHGDVLPRRHASWRASRPPSSAQLNYAKVLGITGADIMTKARLSDEMSVHIVSKWLDSR
jgi:superfamily II DNA or RNA helicase